MTMIEKVARALAYSAGARIAGPGQSYATRAFGWRPDGAHFDQYVEAHWKEHVHAAGFAISAMREPTEAMLGKGWQAVYDACGDGSAAINVWYAMIDAALAGETK